MPEKRFYFLRNKERVKQGLQPTFYEYEVEADSYIVGGFEDDTYKLSIWEFGADNKGEKRKLCLRIGHAPIPDDEMLGRNPSEKEYYHGGGEADEIIMLSSLLVKSGMMV